MFILAIFAVVDVGFFSGEWGGEGANVEVCPSPEKNF